MENSHQQWQDRWRTGRTGWDLGGFHRDVPPLWERTCKEGGLKSGDEVYVPGCGAGHDAAWIAQQGFQVHAIDWVVDAIEAARKSYAHLPALTLALEDALSVPQHDQGRFDAVFDRAMLCALQPEQRSTYLAACAQKLRAGGLFVGILFTEVQLPQGKGGPPFAMTLLQYGELMEPYFTLVAGWENAEPPGPTAVRRELSCIWQKAKKES